MADIKKFYNYSFLNEFAKTGYNKKFLLDSYEYTDEGGDNPGAARRFRTMVFKEQTIAAILNRVNQAVGGQVTQFITGLETQIAGAGGEGRTRRRACPSRSDT